MNKTSSKNDTNINNSSIKLSRSYRSKEVNNHDNKPHRYNDTTNRHLRGMKCVVNVHLHEHNHKLTLL